MTEAVKQTAQQRVSLLRTRCKLVGNGFLLPDLLIRPPVLDVQPHKSEIAAAALRIFGMLSDCRHLHFLSGRNYPSQLRGLQITNLSHGRGFSNQI